jgi:hypothetical protein
MQRPVCGGSLHSGLGYADWLQGSTSAAYGRRPPNLPSTIPSGARGPRSHHRSHCHVLSLTVVPCIPSFITRRKWPRTCRCPFLHGRLLHLLRKTRRSRWAWGWMVSCPLADWVTLGTRSLPCRQRSRRNNLLRWDPVTPSPSARRRQRSSRLLAPPFLTLPRALQAG